MGDVALENGQRGGPQSLCESVSQQLGKALHKMKSASALISSLIREKRAGQHDPSELERLYIAKGAITCAIEGLEDQLSPNDPKQRQ